MTVYCVLYGPLPLRTGIGYPSTLISKPRGPSPDRRHPAGLSPRIAPRVRIFSLWLRPAQMLSIVDATGAAAQVGSLLADAAADATD